MAFKKTTDVIQVVVEPVAILDIIMEANRARRTREFDRGNHEPQSVGEPSWTMLFPVPVPRPLRSLRLTKDSFV